MTTHDDDRPEICGYCKHYRQDTWTVGRCLLNPPDTHGDRPRVVDTDTCGQFVRRAPKRALYSQHDE